MERLDELKKDLFAQQQRFASAERELKNAQHAVQCVQKEIEDFHAEARANGVTIEEHFGSTDAEPRFTVWLGADKTNDALLGIVNQNKKGRWRANVSFHQLGFAICQLVKRVSFATRQDAIQRLLDERAKGLEVSFADMLGRKVS